MRPLHNLFHLQKGARQFRRELGDFSRSESSIGNAYLKAISCISDEILDEI